VTTAQRAKVYEGVTVRWTRAICYGQPIDRWFASVVRPRESEGFAQIERVNGDWWLVVFPPSSVQRHPQLTTKKVRYAHPRSAKKHFEAWVRVNWPQIEHIVCLRTDQMIRR
jgi:hypothetical protein